MNDTSLPAPTPFAPTPMRALPDLAAATATVVLAVAAAAFLVVAGGPAADASTPAAVLALSLIQE